MRSNK